MLALAIASIGLLADARGGDPGTGSVLREPSSAAPPSGFRNASETLSRRRARKRYWGAWIGDQLTGVQAPFDMQGGDEVRANRRQAALDRSLGLAVRRLRGRSCSFYPFPVRAK